MLDFIILACQLNVAVPDINSKGCKEFHQTVQAKEGHPPLTPYSCMMQSMPELAKFVESNPGWVPKRWTCRDLDRKKANPKQETNT
jgi:hypothetical protein